MGIRIFDLTAQPNPTQNWEIMVDKQGESSAKKLLLSKLANIEVIGNPPTGIITELKQIGTWNMRTAAKKTLTLTNPSTIVGIMPGFIFSDDDKLYPFHAIYDALFYQNLQNIGRGSVSTSGDAAIANSNPSAVTGNGTTNNFKLLARGAVASNGTAIFDYQSANVTSISKANTGEIRYIFNHNLGDSPVNIDVQPFAYPATSEDFIAPAWEASYFTNRIEVQFETTASVAKEQYFKFQIYQNEANDNHTHPIGDHTHPVTASGNFLALAGYNGRNISVNYEWAYGSQTLNLTHNYLGDDYHVDSAFGVPSSRTADAIMANFQNASNRGFIQIIRRYDS